MADVPLPPADKVLKLGNDIDGNIEYVYHYTADQMQAHAAAVSAERDARIKVLEDLLWVLAEHNELHFGKSHSTVIQCRAVFGELK